MSKFILDACCGGRMFWFDKKHPNTLYIDNRVAEKGHEGSRPNHSVLPDIVMDFRDLKFDDSSFKLVVFDPPHLKSLGKNSKFRKQYGSLDKNTWQDDLSLGFSECWRVLDDYGVLVFKWYEHDISLKEVLELTPHMPLFGHPNRSKIKTHWLCFMKIPTQQSLDKGDS